MNADELTSDALDGLLDDAETVDVARPDGPTEMRLYVTIDAETFEQLSQRAARDGTGIGQQASTALRRGARVA